MGMQTILLRSEVNVEIHGHGVMGGFDHGVVGQGTPGAPTVQIRGFSLWAASASSAKSAELTGNQTTSRSRLRQLGSRSANCEHIVSTAASTTTAAPSESSWGPPGNACASASTWG